MAAKTLTERSTALAAVGLKPLLTPTLLADFYGVSDWTVRQWVKQGCPTEPIRVGRGQRFDVDKVQAWMAEPLADAA